MANALWRIRLDGEARLACGDVRIGPQVLLPSELTLTGLLGGTSVDLAAVLRSANSGPVPQGITLLPPIMEQEVWAAGVTYERSREARSEESKVPDQYDRVYEAERPEVFFKSAGNRVRGTNENIGIRADSTWDVPEPELGLIANSRGVIVAYTIGNDMSSRSIEGENALYLPQAKYYIGSCAIGPCWVPVDEAPSLQEMEISLRIKRDQRVVFNDTVPVSKLKRKPEELVDWLFRAQDFPEGVILLTGTGLVPPMEFTLASGDEVSIAITGLGELNNRVERVGRTSRLL
jgi:2-dehydro-3-deoxy-D-arabinonate dehydratase